MNFFTNILVCVTQQKTCERLINEALKLKTENGKLHVIHVAKTEWNFLNNQHEGEALEYLFGISKVVGADINVVRSDDIVGTIINFSNEYNVDCIVIGYSKEDYKENNVSEQLRKTLFNTKIHMI